MYRFLGAVRFLREIVPIDNCVPHAMLWLPNTYNVATAKPSRVRKKRALCWCESGARACRCSRRPLMFMCALINNFFEFHGDLFRLFYGNSKAVPSMQHGMGPWVNALTCAPFLGIFASAGLIVLSTGSLERWSFQCKGELLAFASIDNDYRYLYYMCLFLSTCLSLCQMQANRLGSVEYRRFRCKKIRERGVCACVGCVVLRGPHKHFGCDAGVFATDG